MGTLVVMRHGLSEYNAQGRYAGQFDTPLTVEGEAEARAAGVAMAEAGLRFDVAISSELSRAARTLDLAVDAMVAPESRTPEIVRTALLNERRYGDVQHLTREQAESRFGREAAESWLSELDARPPGDAESLRVLLDRTRSAWREVIRPNLDAGRSALVVSHGGTLRMAMVAAGFWDVTRALGERFATAVPVRINLETGDTHPLKHGGVGYVGGT